MEQEMGRSGYGKVDQPGTLLVLAVSLLLSKTGQGKSFAPREMSRPGCCTHGWAIFPFQMGGMIISKLDPMKDHTMAHYLSHAQAHAYASVGLSQMCVLGMCSLLVQMGPLRTARSRESGAILMTGGKSLGFWGRAEPSTPPCMPGASLKWQEAEKTHSWHIYG